MIHRLQLSININAEKSKIWHALWDDNSYREWSCIFSEGSYASCDNWEEGNQILFLAQDKSGIYSIIEKHIPNKIITFKHIGCVLNGEKQPIDEETKKWSGTTEVYTLTQNLNFSTLTIDIDILEEHLDFMNSKLPEALKIIKAIATRN